MLKWFKKAEAPVAIGFTETGVCMIEVRRGREAPAVPVWEFLPAETPEQQDEVLRDAVRRLRMGGRSAYTCLPRDHYALLPVDPPAVEPEERNTALRWLVQDLLPYPAEEAVLDGILSPPQRNGKQKLLAVATRQDDVDQAVQRLAGADLVPAVVDIPEQAMRNLLALTGLADQAVAFLHLERHVGTLLLVLGDTPVMSRRIETGYADLEHLSVGAAPNAEFGISLPGEEREAGVSSPGPQVDRLVLEIQRSIDYHDANFSSHRLDRLYLAPSFSAMPGVTAYMNANLRVQVEVLDIGGLLDKPTGHSLPVQNLCLVTLGLALRGLDGGA